MRAHHWQAVDGAALHKQKTGIDWQAYRWRGQVGLFVEWNSKLLCWVILHGSMLNTVLSVGEMLGCGRLER